MKNINNRRDFLKTSGLFTGALILGFQWQSCKSGVKNVSRDMPNTWTQLNGFISIGDTGKVTIFSPNPEIGQNVKTSMPMIVAEELGINWEDVIVEQGRLDTDVFSRQVAGGSQSIRQGWDSLRQAGATARTMLVQAAATMNDVDPAECSVEDGMVILPNKDKVDFGLLVEEASKLDVPEDVPLKDPKDYKIIGKALTNVDMETIISGTPAFGLDVYEEDMAYARMLRPPSFGSSLVSYDDSQTKTIPGVLDVIKLDDKIAVIAEHTWAAIKGVDSLIVEWSSTAGLESTQSIKDALNKILDNPSSAETKREDGDVAMAEKEADALFHKRYESTMIPHNCLEPMNFFASVESDKVRLKGPIQTPEWTRSRVANLLGRDEAQVTVEMTRQGGGFGRRLYGDFAEEAAQISDAINKPVLLVFTREDDMMAGTYRVGLHYDLTASVKDGKISGYRLIEAATNGGMYGLIPNFFPAAAVDNFLVKSGTYTSKISTGAWRAPYTNFLAFAESSFLDEIAEGLNLDTPTMVIDLLKIAESKNAEEANIEYSPTRMIKVIETVVDKSNWNQNNEFLYKGFCAYYSHNTHVAQVAQVEIIDGLPKVTKIWCVADCGIVINPSGAEAMGRGGIIDGLGTCLYGEFGFEEGKPTKNNFHQYRLIRQNEVPDIEMHFIPSEETPTGLGEPTLPPVAGAVANAIYKATGQRLYTFPFQPQLKKVDS